MSDAQLVKGCCPLDCQDSCAWVAHVQDGRVVRLEGSREHPFTRGSLCAKVNDYPTRTYAADRLLFPLRRTGPKGSGEFTRISWDEAVDTIATRFTEIIAAHSADALLPLHFMGAAGVVQRRSLMRLFHALGASYPSGSICGASGNVLAAEGQPRGFDPEEVAHSELIVLWGSNILTTCHHHWHFIEEARRQRGAKIVCIDPRRTRTTQRADQHLAIRPGTDWVLAAGLTRVHFAERLADLEFARAVAADVDQLREVVEPWTPERVASVCDIEPTDVLGLGRALALARPAVIRSGIAPQQTVDGDVFVRSIAALAILGGHWKLPGGGLFIETYPVFHDRNAERPDLLQRPQRRLDMARLGELLTDAALSPPVKALIVWGTNPAVVQPDAGRARRGLAREDLFTVVLGHFLTDTARYADIVLPSTTQLEHFDVQGAWGHHYISLNQPAVAPQGEAKSHGEVMRLLARRLGLDHPALRETDEQIAASALPAGITLDELKASGWKKSSAGRPHFGAGELRIAWSAPEPPALLPAGQLQLLTPKSHFFMNTSFANMPRHRRSMGRPTLEMNVADASARGLADGQHVAIANEQGQCEAWLGITDGVRPGVVVLQGGWWVSDSVNGNTANVLAPAAWAPSGQPAYNQIFVHVSALQTS